MINKLFIAVCDDTPMDRQHIAACVMKYLDERDYFAQIDEFSSGEALLQSDTSVYNLIILDIFMGELNGIQVARQLMETSPDTRIIFCSISNEFAAESYDVAALRYLTKPVSEEKLYQTLDHFFNAYTAMRTLEYRRNRMIEHVLISEVLWIEASDHKSLIHTRQGEIITTTTISQFSEQVLDAGFVKPIRYALVSLAAVATVPTDVLTLIDGTRIPISRDLREEMKKAFTAYKTKILLTRQRGGL
ncbi:MAG: LytR/AlgR family response regulator transcription factor [Eubacteriales bacterium]